jgi:hypothetical protein
MNIKNKLKVWKPIEDLPPQMFVEALHDDYEGFRILLKGESFDAKTLRIGFEDRLSYRNIDADYLSKYWASFLPVHVTEVFYIVENSALVDEFLCTSEGLYPSNWTITHYAIYTQQDCIDVLSYHPPSVEWLN